MNRLSLLQSILILGLLSGCAPEPPLPEMMLRPSDKIYSQIQKKTYLSGKIAIGEFSYDAKRENLGRMFENTRFAAQQSLTKAGLLARDPNKAEFILNGTIKDVAMPHCMFGTCETGSSIEYVLSHAKTGRVAYRELLVVPHNFEYPAFGSNMPLVIKAAMGGAIGENLAHLIHLLTLKTKKDLS
jgi:hypothetical protein